MSGKTREGLTAAPGMDRRIERTRALLHEALGSLVREKSYDRITIADVLERANVGRSTFYTHFRDKDDLLASSMRGLLSAALSVQLPRSSDLHERMVAFSRPLFEHIEQHRRSARSSLGDRGRAILHERVRELLVEWIVADIDAHPGRRARHAPRTPPELLARYVASTFVLVLHWWLDEPKSSSSGEADQLFRALVMPTLRAEG
jgi:AcrR family transcriptional regulator